MNCIKCEELISDYLEGALDTQTSQDMETHLLSCAGCTELLAGVREVLAWGKTFPAYEPQPWLATRIIAATPQVIRETWLDPLLAAARWLIEPRTAMALFTATLVLGWLGSLAGVNNSQIAAFVREPSALYYQAEGFVNRAYGDAVQRYYRMPVIARIQLELERMREIS
jgi:hypothetical protein